MFQYPMEVKFPGLGISLKVNNVAISIGGFEVYWYAVLILTGFVLAVLYAYKNARRFHLNSDDMFDVIIIGLICSLIGARAYYVIFYENHFDSFWDMINIRDGGIAIYGAVIGAFLSGWLTCRYKKMNTLAMFDVAGIGFLIGQCIGRWGNFVNQEAFGSETSLPWGMMSAKTGFVTVHPCFLYESLWCIIGFIILDYLSRRWYKFYGQYFIMYLCWYGLGRVWIEGLRTDSLWLIPDVIRVSQLVAAICVLAAVPLIILGMRGKIFKPVIEDCCICAEDTQTAEN